MTLPMLVLLALIYFLLGAGVKYIDAAYDDNTFGKRCTLLLSTILGILAGTSMIWDQPTLIIFLSLIMGVAISRKLDILPFRVLATIAILLPLVYYRLSLPLSGRQWQLVILLSMGAIIDEIGNDLADNRILKGSTRIFFLYRGYLKMVIILIAFLRYLPGKYVIAFLSFDFGYLLLTHLSARRQVSQHYGFSVTSN